MPTQSEREGHFGDPKAGITIYIAVVGTLIFVLTVIYLETLYYISAEQQRIEKTVDRPLRELIEHREQQRRRLTSYDYHHAFAEFQGRVTIPIEEAKARLLEEWPEPRIPAVEVAGEDQDE